MRFEPISWQRLAEAVADRLEATGPAAADGGDRLKLGVDGAPAAPCAEFAERIADVLRGRGRPVLTVATDGFLRPASLRFEYGKQDPDAYYSGWYDTGALWREVFGPLAPDGTGRVLPDLWNPVTDRATRSPAVPLPPGGVLIVHGPFLLGHWFPFDLTAHLHLSPAALARRTAEPWTLPAFARYTTETDPAGTADTTVRADDPRRPAWTGFRS
ncbi:uridine kinase [Streptomyces sp. NPDC090025]|uniref:uridine kinase n=1 Tax=Streptomyces sp. NPDC090025 TaxID=3365922 RepID=UPI003832CD27